MPTVQIKALVELTPGDRLFYDCPNMGGDWKSDVFFKAYRHKIATFVGYLETFVGSEDYMGREPGRYLDPKGIRVMFDGETEVRSLNYYHFVLLPEGYSGEDLDHWLKSQRLGPLPEEIAFAPLDLVCFVDDLLKTPRRVKEVCVDSETGATSYRLLSTKEEHEGYKRGIGKKSKEDRPLSFTIFETPPANEFTRHACSELVLLDRGPLSLLRSGASADEIGSALEDRSDALAFWTYYARGESLPDSARPRSLAQAIEMVEQGNIVFINDHDGVLVDRGHRVIDLYRIKPKFEKYAEHVRELSLKHWRSKFAEKKLYQPA